MQRHTAISAALAVLLFVSLASAQKKSKYACDEPNPRAFVYC